jgi:hypothetical protein
MSKNDEATQPNQPQPHHDDGAKPAQTPVQPKRSTSTQTGNGSGLDGLGGGRLP